MTTYEKYLREQVNGRGVREKDCPRCGGDGFVENDDGPRMFMYHTCTYCAGRRRVPDYDCDTCADTGVVENSRSIVAITTSQDVPMLTYCEDCGMGEYAEDRNVLDTEPWGQPRDAQWLEEMKAIARGEAL